ncbi:zinc-ribbon domain-containing protein [Austwickia chelonae]|nr:zinc-ribbon domain-containing protein [Austwickia chelonae]
MARYCPECGAELPASARFCVSCGSPAKAKHDAGPGAPAGAKPASQDQSTAAMPAAGGSTAMMPPVTEGAGQAAPPAPRRPRSDTMADQFSAWPDDIDDQPSPWAGPQGGPPATAQMGAARTAQTPFVPGVGGQVPPGMDRGNPGGYPAQGRGLEEQMYGEGSYGEGGGGKRRIPLVPVVLGVAVLLIGAVIWALTSMQGSSKPAKPAAKAPVVTTTKPSSSTTSAPSDPASRAQAARSAVGSVLDAGRGSRLTLVQGIDAYCSKGDKEGGKRQMDDALKGRLAQLAKLDEVGDGPFKDIPEGPRARDQLKAALQASADADQIYMHMATAGTVCQGSSELTQANSKASSAKETFLGSWNPLMSSSKLPGLKAEDI